jgi:hypothetical protein
MREAAINTGPTRSAGGGCQALTETKEFPAAPFESSVGPLDRRANACL